MTMKNTYVQFSMYLVLILVMNIKNGKQHVFYLLGLLCTYYSDRDGLKNYKHMGDILSNLTNDSL